MQHVICSGPSQESFQLVKESLESAQGTCEPFELPFITFFVGKAADSGVSFTVHVEFLSRALDGSWIFRGYCGSSQDKRIEASGFFHPTLKIGELTLKSSVPPSPR